MDALAQQIIFQARDAFTISARIAEKHERVDERLEEWPAPGQQSDRNGESRLEVHAFFRSHDHTHHCVYLRVPDWRAAESRFNGKPCFFDIFDLHPVRDLTTQ